MSSRKDRPRDPDRARHMLEAAQLVVQFVNGRSFQDLLNDALFRSAVERQFEILGEAASHVSTDTQSQWPSIDRRSIRNFRNLLAHEYFRTDYAQVWDIAQRLLPALIPTLEALFADLDQKFGPDASV